MNYIFTILRIDIEVIQLYEISVRYYDILCRLFNTNILMFVLNRYNVKLNSIRSKLISTIFLGQGTILFFFLLIFIINDIYIQCGLGIFICLDCIIKDFKNSVKLKPLTPSLNIYYPIVFSIFSVTIRITGVFLSLILGLCFLCLVVICSLVWGYTRIRLFEFSFTSCTYYYGSYHLNFSYKQEKFLINFYKNL